MDDVALPNKTEDRAGYQQVLSQYGGPAFMRRAHAAEAALAQLQERLAALRRECLSMVGLRLATLAALTGTWDALLGFITPESAASLRRLHDELRPTLRMAVAPSTDPSILRRAVDELADSLTRFNRRWQEHLVGADLREVNRRRDEYNRWYVLEKECVVGSPRIARQGFRPLPPITREDLAGWFPLLPLPVPAR